MKDYTGMRFGKLFVIMEATRIRKHVRRLQCLCDCGNNVVVNAGDLVSGHTKSCGCYNRHIAKMKATKHGKACTAEWWVWAGMHKRCKDRKCKAYKRYGGRGIKVCARWKEFKNFYTDMGKRPYGMQLDRVNNDGDYSKDNCRWATKLQQANNTSANRFITYDGQVRTLAEWGRVANIKTDTIARRIKVGWSIGRALGFE